MDLNVFYPNAEEPINSSFESLDSLGFKGDIRAWVPKILRKKSGRKEKETMTHTPSTFQWPDRCHLVLMTLFNFLPYFPVYGFTDLENVSTARRGQRMSSRSSAL